MLPNGTNTYAGLIVAFLTIILPYFGYAPTPELDSGLPELLMSLLQIAGLSYAAWGRARASTSGWFAKI